jgi:hypothetical protein
MAPRTGLYIALVGLLMAGLATLSLLNDWNPYPVGHTAGGSTGFALFLVLGAILGLIVMAVGLVMAGVLALTKKPNLGRKAG